MLLNNAAKSTLKTKVQNFRGLRTCLDSLMYFPLCQEPRTAVRTFEPQVEKQHAVLQLLFPTS